MNETIMPIGTSVVNQINVSEEANCEEQSEERELATQFGGGVNSMYLDFSKIWGMLNGQFYKFMAIIGGRGIGKTYGAWKYILEQYRKGNWNNKSRFMWLRTTDNALKKLKENNGQKVCSYESLKNKYHVRVYTVGSNIYIRDIKGYEGNSFSDDNPDWELWKKSHPGDHVGYLYAVSTFYDLKGTQYEETKLIVYDEVNRERGEKKTFDQSYAFTNQIETIARTRQDIRVLMFGNTIDDASEILSGLNFVPPSFGIYRLRGHRTIVYYVKDSDEFAKAREESLAFVFSGGGKNLPSLQNKNVNEDLFTPQITTIYTKMGKEWVYRVYVTREDFFDVYTFPSGVWVGRTRTSAKPPYIVSINPSLDGVVRYDREIYLTLKEWFHKKLIWYQSIPVAHQFKATLETLGTLR